MSSSSISSPNPTETIDALLEHYLSLLDQYTNLRNQLNALQSSMYQSIARANFSAERGVRYYGQDYYDERMQAGRRVRIRVEGKGSEKGKELGGNAAMDAVEDHPVFVVRGYPGEETEEEGRDETERLNGEKEKKVKEEVKGKDGKHAAGDDSETTSGQSPNDSPQQEPTPQTTTPTDEAKEDKPSTKNPSSTKKNDPLRWFGILTPPALRQAQSHAIQAVERLIPQLATISAEMAAVELAVRRARKRRAKEEKKKKKLPEETGRLEKEEDGGLEKGGGEGVVVVVETKEEVEKVVEENGNGTGDDGVGLDVLGEKLRGVEVAG
jgi:hypothetical protein